MTMENCDAKQEREGQVIQELNKAESAASRLLTRVDELETQLSIVLHQTEPKIPLAMKEGIIENPLVSLALRIRDHYMLLQKLGTRVEEIQERLEIR